jgi:hypothetical protein
MYLGDAHTYIDTGVLPVHREPRFDDLVLEDGETLYTGPSPQPRTSIEEKTSDPDIPESILLPWNPTSLPRRQNRDDHVERRYHRSSGVP